jgi:peptidoglycan-N-acetylglucosamine deacetylase
MLYKKLSMIRLTGLALFLLLNTCIEAQQIAITFDDAPTGNGPLLSGAERTQKILQHLKTEGVRQAAFFVVTQHTETLGTDRLLEYARHGHLLANHSHAHQWIRAIGASNYIKGIAKADSILRLLPNYSHFYRYPFLDEGKTRPVRDSIRNGLKSLGLANGYVTVDNYDWFINGLIRKAQNDNLEVDFQKLKEVYIEHIWNSIVFYENIAKTIIGRSPKHVLLLHENDLAAHFLGDLLRHIKSKGWEIISVEDAYSDPISEEIPDVLFNGQGRVAAIANSKGVAPAKLIQESEDEVYLENLLKEKKVFRHKD